MSQQILKKKYCFNTDTDTTTLMFLKKILGIPEDLAGESDIIELFGHHYIPGIFFISERKKRPNFILPEDNLDYDSWIRNEVKRDLISIVQASDLNETIKTKIRNEFKTIQDEVISILNYRIHNSKELNEIISHQEYPDILRRIISFVLTSDPEKIFDTYQEMKKIGKIVAIDIIEQWNDQIDLYYCLKASVASGLIGLDMKSYSAAVSKIYNTSIIPLKCGETIQEKVSKIKEKLEGKINEPMGIDFWKEYQKDVLNTDNDIYMASFTDDYIETIFQMKFYEKQLEYNPKLTIHAIPKDSCYGIDISYDEIIKLLKEPVFTQLKEFFNSGRFLVCSKGPKMGVVNGQKISNEVASILKKSDVVDVKGARSYESLQGIQKIAYFGFAICREISESVTGIPAESGKLVFIRQDPGIHSFKDFQFRAFKKTKTKSGRIFGLARLTANEYALQIQRNNNNLLLENMCETMSDTYAINKIPIFSKEDGNNKISFSDPSIS